MGRADIYRTGHLFYTYSLDTFRTQTCPRDIVQRPDSHHDIGTGLLVFHQATILYFSINILQKGQFLLKLKNVYILLTNIPFHHCHNRRQAEVPNGYVIYPSLGRRRLRWLRICPQLFSAGWTREPLA